MPEIDEIDKNALAHESCVLPFSQRLKAAGLLPLRARSTEILQINVGRRCNLSCKHCHLEAGPLRTETMSREILERCLSIARHPAITTIDVTGGAPEMNPDLPWFLPQAASLGKRLIVRSNLVILLEAAYHGFIDLYCQNSVELVGSLPDLHAVKTDRQRGATVFDREIAALKLLNARGYGRENSGLTINLVHNPVGAFLPGMQCAIEQEYHRRLLEDHGIVFNRLFCLTNNPLGRYRDYLIQSGNYCEYMEALARAFNSAAAENVMCRSTLSVGWDGRLYDCDFNQALGAAVNRSAPGHIREFDQARLNTRVIFVADHCYACTAGAGSSCQGAVKH
jgi:radical SAM/Cys-rich protein